jgi:hypothetical protein
MTRATKPKPEEWYTMQDIVTQRMFAWCPPTFWSVRNVVNLDRQNSNILKATITGTGRATKYHFKGENIIKFIKLAESGKAKLS